MLRDEKWIMDKLRELSERRFFGKVTLEFQAGDMVLLRSEEVTKPPSALAARTKLG
jgi:hypothetical protein